MDMTDDMELDMTDDMELDIRNSDQVINLVRDLINMYDARTIVDAIEPIYVIYNADRFFLPDESKIELYARMFNIIFNEYGDVRGKLFKFIKNISNSTKNGRVQVWGLVNAKNNSLRLLSKEPLFPLVSDPISYEYYVGLTMNKLRINNKSISFSLVYGRYKGTNHSNVFYEYIRDMKDNTMSLYTYMKDVFHENLEANQYHLLVMLCMLMLSLQIAQDTLEFTHYDLHPGNVLIVELSEYKKFIYNCRGEQFVLTSKYVPYIIDFGRTHIKPDNAVKYGKSFKDVERNMEFNTFKEYQDYLFGTCVYKFNTSQDYINDNINKFLEVNSKVSNYLDKKKFRKMYGNMYDDMIKTFGFKETVFELTRQTYFYTNNVVCPITPNLFNKKHDMYRLTRLVCSYLISRFTNDLLPVWEDIDSELNSNYPFYVQGFNLPKDYKPVGADGRIYSKPYDLAINIYKFVKPTESVEKPLKKRKFEWEQLGRKKMNLNTNIGISQMGGIEQTNNIEHQMITNMKKQIEKMDKKGKLKTNKYMTKEEYNKVQHGPNDMYISNSKNK